MAPGRSISAIPYALVRPLNQVRKKLSWEGPTAGRRPQTAKLIACHLNDPYVNGTSSAIRFILRKRDGSYPTTTGIKKVNMLDRMLSIVQQALEEFDSPNYELSGVIRKAVRIARLRNDYENLWWLQEEMIESRERKARERVENEIKPHYSADDFEEAKRDVLRAYFSERSVRTLEDENVVDDDNICDLSVPNIEDRIKSLTEGVKQQVPPPGMHTLDLYHAEKRYAKLRSYMTFTANEYAVVLRRIENRVHEFLSTTEKQLVYGQINSDIFERNRQYVDSRLRAIAPEALDKLVSVYRRLGEGDDEARSQALLSCRRILKSLADSLYPPRAEPVVGPDGKPRRLTEDKYISRLWQFVYERVKGRAAGDLLLAQINDTGGRIDHLYKLDNKGVHFSASEFEVNQAVIQTYLLIGDILRLADGNSSLESEKP
jgi:hypothetical protein